MSFRIEMVLITAITLTALAFAGCSNYEFWSEACDDCILDEPTEGELRLTFLIDENHPEVPYKVYEGTVETGILLFSDTADTEEVIWVLSADREYAAEAEYSGSQKTIVIDGDKIRTQTTSCTDENDPEATLSCWYVIPARLDLRLKTQSQ